MKGVCCNNGNGQRCSVLFFILVVILVSYIVTVVDGFMISTSFKAFGSSSQISKLSFLVRNKPMSFLGTTARGSTLKNNNDEDEKKKKKVAIIGAGAAGLATAKKFMEYPNQFEITILEQRSSLGGVWKYNDDDNDKKKNPMYRGLRTNLPCELMAYRDFPWTSNENSSSYVTHDQVLQYLQDYAHHFQISPTISHSCQVTQLTLSTKDNHCDEEEEEEDVQIELEWNDQSSSSSSDLFDVVCVCNGHYAVPSKPLIPGLEQQDDEVTTTASNIRILHSMEYDDPKEFENEVVLCIGGRASGADLAREISQYATKVYLSDTSCKTQTRLSDESNVIWVPKTVCAKKNGNNHNNVIELQDGSNINDVTVIIYCTGYDYQFPFVNQQSNLHDFQAIPGERRVMPLYQQLWHPKYPHSLSFVGLQHSVVPFPFFEFQAQAIVSELLKKLNNQPSNLPSLEDRLKQSQEDANSGGPKSTRVQVRTYLTTINIDT